MGQHLCKVDTQCDEFIFPNRLVKLLQTHFLDFLTDLDAIYILRTAQYPYSYYYPKYLLKTSLLLYME
jgi:hypothetical protein